MTLEFKYIVFLFVLLIVILCIYIEHIYNEIKISKIHGYKDKNQKYYYLIILILVSIIISLGKIILTNLKLTL